jgi:hypothetical protein
MHFLEGLRQIVRIVAVTWLRELDFRALELGGVFDLGGHEFPNEAYLVESSSVVTMEYKN